MIFTVETTRRNFDFEAYNEKELMIWIRTLSIIV